VGGLRSRRDGQRPHAKPAVPLREMDWFSIPTAKQPWPRHSRRHPRGFGPGWHEWGGWYSWDWLNNDREPSAIASCPSCRPWKKDSVCPGCPRGRRTGGLQRETVRQYQRPKAGAPYPRPHNLGAGVARITAHARWQESGLPTHFRGRSRSFPVMSRSLPVLNLFARRFERHRFRDRPSPRRHAGHLDRGGRRLAFLDVPRAGHRGYGHLQY
jgi:hypothetical protein